MGDSTLAWQDNAVIVLYLAGMIALGAWLGRKKRTDEEYFLAGRSMPWFAVGVSVIASILSSITYLSEPGEVWKSGITHLFGKMLAIPLEMAFVWLVCIPFLMRFRYTSVYEYLGHRFGNAARLFGVTLFILLVVMWMGIVVMTSALALSKLGGWDLELIIVVVGLVATAYTMLGGLRAVIWTDVVQVTLLIGGGLFTIGYVIIQTGTWIPDWYAASVTHLQTLENPTALKFFDIDPTTRATIVTVAINMMVWHVCTHLSNQMTVQRYFSTSNRGAARKSFLTGTLLGVGINLMLMVTGLALLYFYIGQETAIQIDGGLDTATKERDLIFPTFAINRLPAGVGGAILAALIAAAMSSIDSGINSIATVFSVELRHRRRDSEKTSHVRLAMGLTLGAGLFITAAAIALSNLPEKWSIIDLLPRTFNAITAPLGALFLIGMFMTRAKQRSAITGTICGLITAASLGYLQQIGGLLMDLGILKNPPPELSFTWIMPGALTVALTVAWLMSRFDPKSESPQPGMTWWTRNDLPDETQPD